MIEAQPQIPSTPPLPRRCRSYDGSGKILGLLRELVTNVWQEEVWIISLNNHLQIIGAHMVFRGTANSCLVHPRDIFRLLIADNATRFVMAHNHPAGKALPSREDLRLTERLAKAGRLMEIPLLDHVILAGDEYYSFADRGRIKTPV